VYQPIYDKLVYSSHDVKLVKIPGHSDIISNDTAEQKAKDIASKIKRFVYIVKYFQ